MPPVPYHSEGVRLTNVEFAARKALAPTARSEFEARPVAFVSHQALKGPVSFLALNALRRF